MAGLLFWGEKKYFKVDLESAYRQFLLDRNGKVKPCRGAEDGKSRRTNRKINVLLSVIVCSGQQLHTSSIVSRIQLTACSVALRIQLQTRSN